MRSVAYASKLLTKLSHTAVLSTAVWCLCTGCGDNLAGPDAAIDAERIDAAPCPIATSGYGALAFASTRAGRIHDGAGKETVAWLGALQAGPMSDVLDIQLLEGHGVFASGPPRTGMFALNGAESQLATCGTCVVLQVSAPRQYLVVQSGTLTIAELGPTGSGRFVGSLTNATLARVTIDPVTNESRLLHDGCRTSITSASWDTPIN